MIFSISEYSEGNGLFNIDQTDIFCFFSDSTMVKLPKETWLIAIQASLRMKKNVLVLEKPLTAIPTLNLTARWHVGADFLWLAPRSASVLFEAPLEISRSYESLKIHLNSFK